jgi:WD40 repeat protein
LFDDDTGQAVSEPFNGGGWSTAIAAAPEGAEIVSGSTNGDIVFRSAETGKVLRRVEGHESAVRTLAFSKDGKWMASAADDGKVCVWGFPSGRKRVERAEEPNPLGLYFLPNEDGLISVHDVDGSAILRFDGLRRGAQIIERSLGYGVISVAFAADGKLMAAGHDNGAISVWNLDGLLADR